MLTTHRVESSKYVYAWRCGQEGWPYPCCTWIPAVGSKLVSLPLPYLFLTFSLPLVRIQPCYKPSFGFTAFKIKFQLLAGYRGSSSTCFFRFTLYLASTYYDSSSQPFTAMFTKQRKLSQADISLHKISFILDPDPSGCFQSSFKDTFQDWALPSPSSLLCGKLSGLFLPAPSWFFHNSHSLYYIRSFLVRSFSFEIRAYIFHFLDPQISDQRPNM